MRAKACIVAQAGSGRPDTVSIRCAARSAGGRLAIQILHPGGLPRHLLAQLGGCNHFAFGTLAQDVGQQFPRVVVGHFERVGTVGGKRATLVAMPGFSRHPA